MSGGKGGKKETTEVSRVPGYAEAVGIGNLEKADAISGMGPIRNYGPTVAAFNPTQISSFQNTADTASAFGMGAPSDIMAGMPAPTDFGGMSGYSAAPIVDDALARLKAEAPGQYDAMTGMYMDPVSGERPSERPFAAMNPGILEELMNDYANLRIS